MENSNTLAIESFSFSWLSNKKPPLDYSDKSSSTESHDFDFGLSHFVDPTASLVDADELFSNGLIRPILVDSIQPTSKAETRSYNKPPDPIEPVLGSRECSTWRRVVRKWLFGCVKPMLCRKVGFYSRRKNNVRVDDIDRREREVIITRSYSGGHEYWSEGESSIYEAVLHCKRSIGES